MLHAVLPWDSPDSEIGVTWDKDREWYYRNKDLCVYCRTHIKDGAKTCRVHRAKYDNEVRWPARRLVRLLALAKNRDDLGNCPAIVPVGGLWRPATELERHLR